MPQLTAEAQTPIRSISLEGGAFRSSGLVFARSALLGARVDKAAVRPGFIWASLAVIVSVSFSVGAFLDTLRFFEPDYSLFFISLAPVVLALLSLVLWRPRSQLTMFFAGGVVLSMASRDKAFLRLALEGLERILDPSPEVPSTLYIDAVSLSVDFGPSAQAARATEDNFGLAAQGASVPLPVFDADDEPKASLADLEPDAEEVGTTDNVVPLATRDDDEMAATVEAMMDMEFSRSEKRGDVAPLSNGAEPETVEPDGDEALGDSDDKDLSGDYDDREDEDQPSEPSYLIAPQIFAPVQAKVATLSRLLKERSQSGALSDALDIVERLTRDGCRTEREARALARSIGILQGRMTLYPAARRVLDGVETAGDLGRFRAEIADAPDTQGPGPAA